MDVVVVVVKASQYGDTGRRAGFKAAWFRWVVPHAFHIVDSRTHPVDVGIAVVVASESSSYKTSISGSHAPSADWYGFSCSPGFMMREMTPEPLLAVLLSQNMTRIPISKAGRT